jgi:TonB family C-terminal domain
MELKKSPKANLENKRTMFFQIGILLTLAIVYLAFEWSSTEKEELSFEPTATVVIEEEMVPITQAETAPPPPQITVPVMSDQIEIVDDDIKLEMDYTINTEDDKRIAVEIVNYVQEAAQEEVIEEEEIPFMIVENKPKFQGQEDPNVFRNWVQSRVVYSESAVENGVSGRVTVEFTVDTDGSVKNVRILRGAPDASLDREVIRVISSSPRWEPGRQRDKAVKVVYNFPVVFELR